MSPDAPTIALLLVGGVGTRLWPLSTPARPKPFLRLFAGRSLFQITVERLRAAPFDDVVVVANAAHIDLIRAELAELGLGPLPLVIEPLRRDSAPAVAAGVAFARQEWGPKAILIAAPADHLIAGPEQFAASVRAAGSIARSGLLATIGIPPTSASTAYGYLKRGAQLEGLPDAFAVAQFDEKPDAETAAAYLRAGDRDWNSGIFAFSADAFVREAIEHMPDVWRSAERAVLHGVRSDGCLRLDASAFAAAPRISIDYALFEQSRMVAMTPGRFAWSDIGDWAAVHAALGKDANANATIGQVTLHDCAGSLVVADGVAVTLIGLRDTAVVATTEATFAAPLARAAEVKTLVSEAEPFGQHHQSGR